MERPFPPPMMDTSHLKRKWLDRAYALQSPAQKLDIYLPEKGDGPFPVIAAFHGGAWMFGDKGDAQNIPFLEGLKRGYAVVCVNYRLSGEAIFPSQIFDCKAAIRFIRANAAVFYFDPKAIAAWGSSAGAHLAALLGASTRVKKLEDLSMGNPGVSSEVRAVVDWYGPAEDFLRMDEELTQSGMGIADHSLHESPESRLLGHTITEAPELVRFASPKTYIKPNIPPFLIQHGLKDEIVPVEQSMNFAAEIKKVAGAERATLEIFNEASHADPAFETRGNVQRVLDFLDIHLKGG